MSNKLEEAIAILRKDLAWTPPNANWRGVRKRRLKFIALEREHAEAILTALEQAPAMVPEPHGEKAYHE